MFCITSETTLLVLLAEAVAIEFVCKGIVDKTKNFFFL
jgi:hypothetical protein